MNEIKRPPWLPPSLLDAKLKDSNFTLKWCHVDNLDKRKAEGWTPVSYKELESLSAPTLEDGRSLDSTVRKRELILCKMPREMRDSRNEYYRQKAREMQVGEALQYLSSSGTGYISKEDTISKLGGGER